MTPATSWALVIAVLLAIVYLAWCWVGLIHDEEDEERSGRRNR